MKRNSFPKVIIFLVAVVFLSSASTIYAQKKSDKSDKSEMSCPMMEKMADKNKSQDDCPMMKKDKSETSNMKMDDMSKHPNHYEMVMKNGEKEMGFSQTATTHHFLIMKDGGAIQVEANDASDTENRDKIRTHLAEIAKMFQNGIFTTPFAVHGQVPPGVSEMDKLKNDIRYRYEETEKGARVRISTDNSQALEAIHKFLKFQIQEHKTGDPTSLEN